LDDSSSMSLPIAEEGKGAFSAKTSSRWLELQRIAAILIEYVVALSPQGMDCVFFNRPGVLNATSMAQLAPLFQAPPSGGTPLCGTLRHVLDSYMSVPTKFLLVLVITDGEPSDGSHQDLYNVILRKKSNVHISFTECTDDEAEMDYLDRWDGQIVNFDNNDDYREEVAKVQAVQGQQFKFNRNDYVAKILLATFVRYYFNLDQSKVGGNLGNAACCSIM